MIIDWKVLSHDRDHLLVEYSCGEHRLSLNIRIAGPVEQAIAASAPREHFARLIDPNPIDLSEHVGKIGRIDSNGAAPGGDHRAGPGLRVAGTAYAFEVGGLLAQHNHNRDSLHNIEVESGRVLIRKDSGDVIGSSGDVIEIAVGENHSVEGLEPARTIHWLVSELDK